MFGSLFTGDEGTELYPLSLLNRPWLCSFKLAQNDKNRMVITRKLNCVPSLHFQKCQSPSQADLQDEETFFDQYRRGRDDKQTVMLRLNSSDSETADSDVTTGATCELPKT